MWPEQEEGIADGVAVARGRNNRFSEPHRELVVALGWPWRFEAEDSGI